MRRVDALRLQLKAIDLLRLLHRRFSYKELESVVGVSKSVLAQYITGSRAPTPEQATRIIESILDKLGPASVVMSRLQTVRSIADMQDVVLDPLVLRLTSIWVARRYRGRANKVLSAETIGVPLATAIAMELDADLVLARRTPESLSHKYIRGEAGEPPFNFKVFYVPSQHIEAGDRVLLVDDLARTGLTLEALAKIVYSKSATVEAAIVLVAVGSEWRKRLSKLKINNVYAFIELT